MGWGKRPTGGGGTPPQTYTDVYDVTADAGGQLIAVLAATHPAVFVGAIEGISAAPDNRVVNNLNTNMCDPTGQVQLFASGYNTVCADGLGGISLMLHALPNEHFPALRITYIY